MKITRCLSLFAVSALVAACGGGGDGARSGPPAAALSIPLATALANYVNQTRSTPFSVSGTASASGQSANVTGSGTLSESTSAATFEGAPALRKTVAITGTVTASAAGANASAPLSSTADAFFDASNKPLGASGAGGYCVTTSHVPLPASAPVGSTGTWYSQDCFANSARLAKLGSVTVTYAVEPEGETTVLLKLLARTTDTAGASMPATSTLRVTAAGAVTRVSESTTVSASGATLTLNIAYQ